MKLNFVLILTLLFSVAFSEITYNIQISSNDECTVLNDTLPICLQCTNENGDEQSITALITSIYYPDVIVRTIEGIGCFGGTDYKAKEEACTPSKSCEVTFTAEVTTYILTVSSPQNITIRFPDRLNCFVNLTTNKVVVKGDVVGLMVDTTMHLGFFAILGIISDSEYNTNFGSYSFDQVYTWYDQYGQPLFIFEMSMQKKSSSSSSSSLSSSSWSSSSSFLSSLSSLLSSSLSSSSSVPTSIISTNIIALKTTFEIIYISNDEQYDFYYDYGTMSFFVDEDYDISGLEITSIRGFSLTNMTFFPAYNDQNGHLVFEFVSYDRFFTFPCPVVDDYDDIYICDFSSLLQSSSDYDFDQLQQQQQVDNMAFNLF